MKRVLVVDDEESILKVVDYALSQAGYEVHTVSDGDGAHFMFQEVDPDLVILDVMLPGKSGLDIARDLRAVSNVPIIMLSARGDEVDRILGLEFGAVPHNCWAVEAQFGQMNGDIKLRTGLESPIADEAEACLAQILARPERRRDIRHACLASVDSAGKRPSFGSPFLCAGEVITFLLPKTNQVGNLFAGKLDDFVRSHGHPHDSGC